MVKSGVDGNILVGDVADVRIDKAQLRGDAAIDGKPGIMITVSKQPGVDTLNLQRRWKPQLMRYKKAFPKRRKSA